MEATGKRIKAHALIALLMAILCGCKYETGPDDGPPAPGDGTGMEWPADALRLEETDLNTVFSDGWVHANTSYDWSGGTAAYTRVPGASVSISFAGTRIRWIGWRESTSGIARVWIDGELAGEVDLYTNELEVRAPVFTSEVLEQGQHTLTIESTGRSNPASAGIKVVVDAFEIVDGVAPPAVIRLEETFQTLSFSGEWHEDTRCPACSGGADVWARGPDALAQLGFNGTRIRWLGWRKQLGGVARVYLDGAFAAEIDLYSETPTAQAPLFTSGILDDGPHVLLIEVTGSADPGAGDSIVSLDAFDVAVAEVMTPPAYTIVDLGTLGGAASSAEDLNNRGEVVGWSDISSGQRRAFLYDDGAMIDLGTLVGGSYSEATAINDQGQVAGISAINAHGPQFREFMNGFLWQAGTMQVLEPLYCYCSFNQRHGTNAVYGINESGQAVGWSGTLRGESGSNGDHPALWQSGTGRSIGFIPPGNVPEWEYGRAFAINDSGQVVGDYTPDGFHLGIHERRPFIWRDEIRRELARLPGHASGTALDINGAGMAVGWSGSVDAAVSRAVLWRDGTVRDLGVLPGAANSQALGINASGQIVGWSGAPIEIDADYRVPGWSDTSDPAAARAFLWRHGQMLDLNELVILDEAGAPAAGWVLTEAAAINDAGRIAGTGFRNGEMRAFLLIPR